MTRLVISVVVPTYRRPHLLARCLTALQAQSLHPGCYEVVVADDAASGATRALVERMTTAEGPALRYAAVGQSHGPAAARNVGWREARAGIIAFTDDDCIPDRRWLAAALVAMRPGVAAVRGRVVVPRGRRPSDYERNMSLLETAEFVTANCVCRREALAAVGGFDERFTAAWREDSDLHFKLLNSGFNIAYAGDGVVLHPVRRARWGQSLWDQRKTMFNALLFKKHPVLFRRRIQRPPWRYYAIVAALLGMALTAVLPGRAEWLAAATAAWIALTAWFFIDRLRGTRRTPSHIAELAVTSALIPPLSVFWRLYGAVRFRALFF